MTINSSITVIIVNYNSGVLLAECLHHLQRQTIQPEQVMVVDNASEDESLSNIVAFQNVTVLRMPSNLGFAAANNRALNECGTEFVALLNPDAFPEPDWLEKLLGAAIAHPEVAAFGSRQLRHSNSDVLDGTGDIYHISGLIWRSGFGLRQEQGNLLPEEIFSPCAAAALYRRLAVKQIGGFDEDYFCYVEDVDLGFRLRLAGYRAIYVPDAIVHHVGSAITGGKNSDFSVYHGHRNLVWTFVKDMPGALFWLLLPLHILLNLVSVVWFVVHGQGGVILRAKRDAIKGMPGAWRKRGEIQTKRVASLRSIWQMLDKRLVRI